MSTTKHHIAVNNTMEPGGEIEEDSPNANAWYNLLKDEEIGLEQDRNGFTNLKKKNKLKAIKETFRKI